MASKHLRYLIYTPLMALAGLSIISCNSKEEEITPEIAVTPASVEVKKFYLLNNDSVMSHLDSVFFSIDLNNGVIFNADSLPKGTKISRLIPSITFANTMTKAELKFVKDDKEEITVDYLTNPGDSVDFTYPVALELTALDGVNTYTYQIRVNVHKENPDSIYWANISTSRLPSRFAAPVAQKSVIQNDIAYCLIEEYNGEFTLAKSSDLNEALWEKKALSLDFTPSVADFTALEDSFIILSSEGNLYESNDAENWESTNEKWLTILGNYGKAALGVKEKAGILYHAVYPAVAGISELPVAENFPVYGSSAIGLIESKWADRPIAILVGGVTENGSSTGDVWCFDGTSWDVINTGYLPALESPMMARYVVFRKTPYLFDKKELDIWLLFGGLDAEGNLNREVYLSYNNGVNWQKAPASMQLPSFFPTLTGADVIVAGYDLTADLSEAWTKKDWPGIEARSRSGYTLEGFDITWNCPYLYVIGGYLPNGSLSEEIWRGVLGRLTFTPKI